MDARVSAPTGPRYPRPSDEDLVALSRLAFDLSATECEGCRSYHVLWPTLRAIGGNGSGPEWAWEPQRDIIARVIGGLDSTRCLIAGAADSGVLALLRASFAAAGRIPAALTVVDRCGTPLGVCRAYAEAAGFPLETVRRNLLDFSRPAAFDLIVLHHVLNFFDAAGRIGLLAMAARWLAPGGRLLIFLTDKTTAASATGRPTIRSGASARRAWQRRVLEDALSRGEIDLPEDAATFLARFDGWDRLRAPGAREATWDLAAHHRAIAESSLATVETIGIPFADEEAESVRGTLSQRIVCICKGAGR